MPTIARNLVGKALYDYWLIAINVIITVSPIMPSAPITVAKTALPQPDNRGLRRKCQMATMPHNKASGAGKQISENSPK